MASRLFNGPYCPSFHNGSKMMIADTEQDLDPRRKGDVKTSSKNSG